MNEAEDKIQYLIEFIYRSYFNKFGHWTKATYNMILEQIEKLYEQ